MIYVNQTLNTPYNKQIVELRQCNLSLVNDSNSKTFYYTDLNNIDHKIKLDPNVKTQILDTNIFQFWIEGSGYVAVSLSYPEIIDPDLVVPSSEQKTDIGTQNDYLKDTKIPYPVNLDGDGNIGIGLPPNAIDPRQIRPITETLNTDVNSKIPTPTAAGNLPTSFSEQKTPSMINENAETGFASHGATASWIEISITVQPNTHIVLRDIEFKTTDPYGFSISSDTGGEPTIDFIGNLVKYGSGNGVFSLGHRGVVITNGTSGTWSTSSGNLVGNFRYDRKIITGSSSKTIFVKISQTNSSWMSLDISYDVVGSVSITVSDSGNTTGTTTTGGGCWSGDTVFINGKGKPQRFEKFKPGDLILTINGFEPIQEIRDSGIHEVLQIHKHTWITPLQPFSVDMKRERHISEYQYQNLPRKFVRTYDCKVKSIWLVTYDSIYIKDLKITP